MSFCKKVEFSPYVPQVPEGRIIIRFKFLSNPLYNPVTSGLAAAYGDWVKATEDEWIFYTKEGQYDLYDTFKWSILSSLDGSDPQGKYEGTCKIVSWDLSRVKVFNSTFYGCTGLVGEIPPIYVAHGTYTQNPFSGTFITKAGNVELHGDAGTGKMFFCGARWLVDGPTSYSCPESSSIWSLFNGCENLKNLPTLNCPNVSDVDTAFGDCYKAEAGITEAYQYLSGLASVTSHTRTFRNCGKDSEAGAAATAQIPDGWK